MELGRVFVIDVSGPSVARGVVQEVCEGIRRAVYGSKRREEVNGENGEDGEGVEEEMIGKGERVAIVTVAETVGFWNLSVSQNRALDRVALCKFNTLTI